MLAPFCANLSSQYTAATAWLLCFVYFFSAMLVRPFRSPSSNLLNVVVAFGLLLDCVLLVFTVQGIRTSFTLPSRSFMFLTGINGACVVTVLGICAWFRRREVWPTYIVLEQIPEFAKHISCVRGARVTLLKCQGGPDSTVPLHDLEADMRRLRNSLLSLLKKKSVMAIIVSDLLDECASFHTSARGASLLPGRALGETLDVAGVDLVRRRKLQVLQPPRKRRILLKLLAVRFFIGDRDIESLVTWETEILKDAERLKYEYSKLFGGLTAEEAFGDKFLSR